jgi:hypothetical protein
VNGLSVLVDSVIHTLMIHLAFDIVFPSIPLFTNPNPSTKRFPNDLTKRSLLIKPIPLSLLSLSFLVFSLLQNMLANLIPPFSHCQYSQIFSSDNECLSNILRGPFDVLFCGLFFLLGHMGLFKLVDWLCTLGDGIILPGRS